MDNNALDTLGKPETPGKKMSCDVVVVGAGMVGASAALGLNALGYRVLMVDTFPDAMTMRPYTPSYDDRSTALSWGSRMILEQLGIWSDLGEHVCPITQVHVSEQGRMGTTRLNAAEFNVDALGYVAPNRAIGAALMAAIAKTRITRVAPARVCELKSGQGAQQLVLTNDEASTAHECEVQCQLVVIADGSDSHTARLIGIETEIQDYHQHALIANISTSEPNDGQAFERFTASGPIALLPLDCQTSALVWTNSEASTERLRGLPEDAFLDELQGAFGDRLGRLTRCGTRASYPLRLTRAKEQVRQGAVLLGNAAHSLHPVAGQGFNLALRGLASFLEAVSNERVDAPLRDYAGIRAAVTEHSRDQSSTIFFSDQLVRLFGTRSTLLSVVRDAGLVGLNNLPVAKRAFARRAMGLGTRQGIFNPGGVHESHV